MSPFLFKAIKIEDWFEPTKKKIQFWCPGAFHFSNKLDVRNVEICKNILFGNMWDFLVSISAINKGSKGFSFGGILEVPHTFKKQILESIPKP